VGVVAADIHEYHPARHGVAIAQWKQDAHETNAHGFRAYRVAGGDFDHRVVDRVAAAGVE